MSACIVVQTCAPSATNCALQQTAKTTTARHEPRRIAARRSLPYIDSENCIFHALRTRVHYALWKGAVKRISLIFGFLAHRHAAPLFRFDDNFALVPVPCAIVASKKPGRVHRPTDISLAWAHFRGIALCSRARSARVRTRRSRTMFRSPLSSPQERARRSGLHRDARAPNAIASV